MNLLLLHPQDHITDNRWRLTGRRAEHVRHVLGLTPGATLRAGILNGNLGEALLTKDHGNDWELRFEEQGRPPAPLPLTLIIALPRPKMLKRLLIDATSLGIKRIVLLNSWKVEKSYWNTPELHAELLREKMLLGLEQAGDTQLPELLLRPRFKPFVEDELPTLAASTRALLAHPPGANVAPTSMPMDLTEPVTLAVGPEGGWTDYELSMLEACGFERHGLGQRILRVETALPTLVGRIMRLL